MKGTEYEGVGPLHIPVLHVQSFGSKCCPSPGVDDQTV